MQLVNYGFPNCNKVNAQLISTGKERQCVDDKCKTRSTNRKLQRMSMRKFINWKIIDVRSRYLSTCLRGIDFSFILFWCFEGGGSEIYIYTLYYYILIKHLIYIALKPYEMKWLNRFKCVILKYLIKLRFILFDFSIMVFWNDWNILK